MKKAIVLAGGYDQIALIKELKKRGYYVYLIDYYENPPAKNYVGRHFVGSTLDLDFVRAIAKEIRPDLITTACTDQALLTSAEISEELGLPTYISAETAKEVTNKSYMKKKMWEVGIPTSKYYIIKNIREIDDIEISYPVVIKPADCNSSKGVKKAQNITELINALTNALKISRTNTAIVEEFKHGKEFSADFYIEHGKAQLLSVTESKKIPDNGAFTIVQSVYPATTELQNRDIENIGQRIADSFGIDNSPLLVQFIEDDGQFFVIEFSARMGGGSKYKLIEVISGVCIMSKYVDLVTGVDSKKIEVNQSAENIEVDYIYCKNGILESVYGIEQLLQDNTIDFYFQYKMLPSKITQSLTSGDRLGGVLISGKNSIEVLQKRNKFNRIIRGISADGVDIVNHEIINQLCI